MIVVKQIRMDVIVCFLDLFNVHLNHDKMFCFWFLVF